MKLDHKRTEAVARAICWANGMNPDLTLGGDGENFLWHEYEHEAEAAITAYLATAPSDGKAATAPDGAKSEFRYRLCGGKWTGWFNGIPAASVLEYSYQIETRHLAPPSANPSMELVDVANDFDSLCHDMSTMLVIGGTDTERDKLIWRWERLGKRRHAAIEAATALSQPPETDAVAAERGLRAANVARDIEWNAGAEKISPLFRAIELAGEVGEACNVIKKLERERLGIVGSRDTKEHLAEELADVVICADLAAMDYDIDLEAAIEAKFNATSVKNGLATRYRRARTDAATGARKS